MFHAGKGVRVSPENARDRIGETVQMRAVPEDFHVEDAAEEPCEEARNADFTLQRLRKDLLEYG